MLTSVLEAELAQLDSRGLTRRRRVLETAQGTRVRVDGRDCLAFCSNDYLGLAAHPAVVAELQRGAARFGVGAGASHLVTGHGAAHHDLEDALARHVGQARALLFSSGYLANIAMVTTLAGRDDVICADRLNHASLNDAALLSRAVLKRFPHGDLAVLERLLSGSMAARRRLIVSDAVFSMDGDIAAVQDLLALAEKYDAWLLLDDAHGFGVLGEAGAGTLSHAGVIASPRVVYMATLGKAAGVSGAFVAGDARLTELLMQRARSYVYTTAMPPPLACALLKSLELIAQEQWRRDHLAALVALLRAGLADRRWRLSPSVTPIQPLIVGGNDEAVALSGQLEEQGLLVPAIRPPTVPQGSARLRISLSAAHSTEDVQRLVAALHTLQ